MRKFWVCGRLFLCLKKSSLLVDNQRVVIESTVNHRAAFKQHSRQIAAENFLGTILKCNVEMSNQSNFNSTASRL
jgi:hypothetical protein